MGKPNFSSYSMEELLQCKLNIDKNAWPERYQEILECIDALKHHPEQKKIHDEIVFVTFCESLRSDLAIAIDDNLWPFLKLFSKKARHSLPSTFDGEVCPICFGQLAITQAWGRWNIKCRICNLDYTLRERVNRF